MVKQQINMTLGYEIFGPNNISYVQLLCLNSKINFCSGYILWLTMLLSYHRWIVCYLALIHCHQNQDIGK